MKCFITHAGLIHDSIVKLPVPCIHFYFSDNDVDLEVLMTMSEEDLKEVGVISFGMRRKIVMLIKKTNPVSDAKVVCKLN